MSYDDQISRYDKEHIYVLDLLVESCSLIYGNSPCQASLGDTGQRKCYNTRATCQDLNNFDPEIKRYRHCEGRSFLPANLVAVPDIESVELSPARIEIGGGLGVRASATITMRDAPSSDIEADKYVSERIDGTADADGDAYNPTLRGTRWGKFKARNPFYTGSICEVFSGYITDGVFDIDNFQRRTYVIEVIDGPSSSGVVRLVAKDPLKLTDIDRAQAPQPSVGRLGASITDTDTEFTLEPEGVGDLDYPSSGLVRINDEIMSFSRTGDSMTVARAQEGTEADEHSGSGTVQLCLVYQTTTVADVIFDLATEYADIPAEFIDKSAWDTESADNFPFPVNAVISEPVAVKDLLIEIAESAPHQLWWDERVNLINFQAIKEPPSSTVVLNDNSNFIADSVRLEDKPEKRISQVWFYFGQRNRTKSVNEINNYRQIYVRADAQQEQNYGSRRIKTVRSRWINAAAIDFVTRSASLIGRRFSRVPREATFALTSKDSDIWLGDIVGIRHRNQQDETGAELVRNYQITSVSESASVFQYRAMEVLFAAPLPQDDVDPSVTLIASNGDRNVVISDLFVENFGPIPSTPLTVNYLVPDGVTVGGTTDFIAALQPGAFPSNITVNVIVEGRVQGAGGAGGNGGSLEGGVATDGSHGAPGKVAFRVGVSFAGDCSITVNGELWGGGGGGGGGGAFLGRRTSTSPFVASYITGSGGGAGAGDLPASGGIVSEESIDDPFFGTITPTVGDPGEPSTTNSNGSGGDEVTTGFVGERNGSGGDGGGPGENGQPGASADAGTGFWDSAASTDGGSGGLAGPAISVFAGRTLELVDNGDIRGSILGDVT